MAKRSSSPGWTLSEVLLQCTKRDVALELTVAPKGRVKVRMSRPGAGVAVWMTDATEIEAGALDSSLRYALERQFK